MDKRRRIHGGGIGNRLSLSVGGGDIGYGLSDAFSTDVAADGFSGANLNCVPGPGTRSIIANTGNNLICASGNLVFGNKVNVTDPTIRFTPVAPTKTVAFTTTQVSTTTQFKPTANIAGDELRLWIAYGMIRCGVESGSLAYFTDTYANGTIHTITATINETNAFIYRNGYLIAIIPYSTATISSLDLIIGDIGTFPLNVDLVKFPNFQPIPVALIADNFSGTWPTTSGTAVATEPGGNGKSWVDNLGTWGIAAGKAACSALDGIASVGVATVDAGVSTVWITSTLTRSGNEVGVILNYVDSSNYVRCYHDGTNAKIDVVTTADGVVNKRSTAVAFGAGLLAVRVDADGNYFMWWNNTVIGTVGSAGIAIPTAPASTKVGLYTTNTGNTFDNFRCYSTAYNSLINLISAAPGGWS